MKDLCFVTGLLLGAGIGMVVATKNKRVKKILTDSEQCLCEAMDEVKQCVAEPICECVNNQCSCSSNNTNNSNSTKSKPKSQSKKQNPQVKEN